MHILPVAGSATRFGGIPKYLLPANVKGESLLQIHIETALKVGVEKIVVMAHPSLKAYLDEYLSRFDSRVIVDKINSKTMTQTIIQAATKFSSPGEVISICLPDTITLSNSENHPWQHFLEARTKINSLILYPALENHRGKFGQVLISATTGKIEKIVDKDQNCTYPHIWGGVSISREILLEFNEFEPTIGNCINQYISEGGEFHSVITKDRYFDCGNMSDYLEFLREI